MPRVNYTFDSRVYEYVSSLAMIALCDAPESAGAWVCIEPSLSLLVGLSLPSLECAGAWVCSEAWVCLWWAWVALEPEFARPGLVGSIGTVCLFAGCTRLDAWMRLGHLCGLCLWFSALFSAYLVFACKWLSCMIFLLSNALRYYLVVAGLPPYSSTSWCIMGSTLGISAWISTAFIYRLLYWFFRIVDGLAELFLYALIYI